MCKCALLSLQLVISYADMSLHFTIKLHYGGHVNEDITGYVGGKIAYFDMCSVMGLNLHEMEAMIAEVGIVGEKVDLWY